MLIDGTGPALTGNGTVVLMAPLFRLAFYVILQILGIHYLVIVRAGTMPVLLAGSKRGHACQDNDNYVDCLFHLGGVLKK